MIERLTAKALRSGPRASREKVHLLERLAARRISKPDALLRLHETLCLLQAYPDDARVLAAVNRALEGFPARIGVLAPTAAQQLHDSGIAGTTLRYPFGFPMARWLSRRFSQHVDVEWKRFTRHDRLQEVLGLLVHPMEEEAFSEFGLEWRRWLRLAKGSRRLTDVQFLVEIFERTRVTPDMRDSLFESLALPIAWTLHGPGASRTLARLLWSRPFRRRRRPLGAGTTRDPMDVRRAIAQPLTSLRRAPRTLGARIIDAARAALALRCRELHGISYANPDDVLVADAGRGLRIALIGVMPGHRLPLESFFGYLILQNGVPIGYGGAWHLFGTLEYGVNIFETFRHGESAFVTTQALRALHHALRMRAVVLQPFQVGRGNPEALEAGAFHFYYRIGFRPQDPDVARLAEREQARIRLNARYRTPLTTLERLAGAELVLNLSTGEAHPVRRVRAIDLAALVTEQIARNFGGDRHAAARWASRRIAQALGVPRSLPWPVDERGAFEQLGLLAALIPDLEQWGESDKSRLVRTLRAKGGRSELPYVRLLDGHRRFRDSLETLVAGRATLCSSGVKPRARGS